MAVNPSKNPFSSQLCFAHKGALRDEVAVKFTYRDSDGQTKTETATINTLFSKEPKSVDPREIFQCCRDMLLFLSL